MEMINYEMRHVFNGPTVCVFATVTEPKAILGNDANIFIMAFNREVFERCQSKCLEGAAIVFQAVVEKTYELKGMSDYIGQIVMEKQPGYDFKLHTDQPVKDTIKVSVN